MIEQLLKASLEVNADLLESEAERASYSSFCETLTLDELLDDATAQTCLVLRLQVAYPSRLILSLN